MPTEDDELTPYERGRLRARALTATDPDERDAARDRLDAASAPEAMQRGADRAETYTTPGVAFELPRGGPDNVRMS